MVSTKYVDLNIIKTWCENSRSEKESLHANPGKGGAKGMHFAAHSTPNQATLTSDKRAIFQSFPELL